MQKIFSFLLYFTLCWLRSSTPSSSSTGNQITYELLQHHQTTDQQDWLLRILQSFFLLWHVAHNFLNSADFPVPPGPPIKWNWCLLNNLRSADENSSMECIMLSYAACCFSLLGNNLLRSSKICSCLAISSGLFNNDVASSTSDGIPVGVGKPYLDNDDRLSEKSHKIS